MQTLFQDLRYGARMLLKKPGFTLIAILTLALGIGANTAIFSVVNTVLLRPLSFREPQRLVKIWAANTKNASAPSNISYPNFVDWRDQNQSFEGLAAHFSTDYNLTGAGEPERLSGVRASANLLTVLGVSPVLGRGFLPDEDRPGGNAVAMLSYSLWQRRFGGDPQVIGKTMSLDGNSVTIIGVMPADFNYVRGVDIWRPIALNPNQTGRLSLFMEAVGRLKPGVTLNQAMADMKTVTSRLEEQYPRTNKNWTVRLVPLQEDLVGSIRTTLLILLGAVSFVLLIACANVANLLLSRAAARQKEIAIRSALGAGRFRIVRQLLTESALLSLLGGLFGFAIAFGGIRAITKFGTGIPRLDEISLDLRVLGFTFAVSILTGLIFGLAPALQASRSDLNEALKDSVKGAASGGKHRLRSALVVAEVALALMLLIGAGLLLRSFQRLEQVNLGFNPDNVLTFDLALPRAKYSDQPQQIAFFEQTLNRLKAVSGVEDAAVTSALPLSGQGGQILFYAEGRPARGPEDYTAANYNIVSPSFFRVLGIPLLRGRDLTEQDRAGAPGVVIVSESMARRFWPQEDALGKRLKLGTLPNSQSPWLEVIGIAADVKQNGLESREGEVTMYTSYWQSPSPLAAFMVRGRSAVAGLTAAMREAVQAVDKDQPLANLRTLEQIVAENFAQRRFSLWLLGIFAGVALLLAAVGIYGVMAYSVTQRTREIGVRMALGAGRREVLRLIVGQGVVLTGAGVVIGLGASFALTRLMQDLLYGVSPTDPLTFAALALLLTFVALAACYIPARRATKVDPMVALRYE